MSPANKMLPPGEQAAVLSASAGILCTGDEYTGPDGLRCCSYCHGHREMRVRLLGRERIVPVLCNCQVEERDKREREMKLRDFQLKRERLREEGLEDKGYYEYCFAKDNKQLIVKGGFADGTVYDAEGVNKLADLESRDVLLAKLAGALKGTMSKAAFAFAALPTKAVRTIDALREKQEQAA